MNNKPKVLEFLLSFLTKTRFCQHKESCVRNAFQGSLEAFGKAFTAKLCLNTLILLLNLKKIAKSSSKLKDISMILINKTNFQLGLFMGLQTFLLKSIQCLLRIVRDKEDGWNAIISGFIAGGASFMTQEQNVKYIIRVYLFGRAVDCIYQHMVQKEYFRHRKLIPCLAFSLMSMLIAYGYFFEPELLPMDTYKMYENFSQSNINDQIWHMCNIQAYRNKIGIVPDI